MRKPKYFIQKDLEFRVSSFFLSKQLPSLLVPLFKEKPLDLQENLQLNFVDIFIMLIIS